MTQEEKQLLLKDLCARLPYGFTVHRYSDNCDITFERNGLDQFAHFLEYSEGEIFKPYLRPMSSMTEEERKEYESFFSIGEHACGGSLYGVEYEYIADDYDDVTQSVFLIDWLNAHHFDYCGLIEKGLALEAPEGMYEN